MEVHFDSSKLMEAIFCPRNLNAAYHQVRSNKGAPGIDKMDIDSLLPYLQAHKDELISSLMEGSYRPNPVRRARIPKDNGKERLLGIPTVVDRMVQQAISQVLTSIYDPTFSPYSYGFRPKRGCHDALRQIEQYANDGCVYGVNLDLERFFDTVNHSRLIELLSRTIKDGRLLSLIHKYVHAGVIDHEQFEHTKEGVPQGGPLSPILSNILLNELDKELTHRGHRFVRYADDCLILCKSKRAVLRIASSITKFVEDTLYLRVNREKTVACYIKRVKYLGYSFYIYKGKCRFRLHPSSARKLKDRLKKLTSRSNGWGYEKCKVQLAWFIRGWVNYYKLADMKNLLVDIDGWLRRRLRMCIWKNWKRVKTRFSNLQKCGVSRNQAWQWANTRKAYWSTAKSHILQRAITSDALRKAGYMCLMDYYVKVYRK